MRKLISEHQLLIRKATYQRTWRSKRAKGTQAPHPQRGTRVSERLAELILLLCQNLAEHASWRGYSYKADMIQDAVLDCLKAVEKIDLSRGTSCFSFLTTTAWRRFARTVQQENARGLRGTIGREYEIAGLPTLLMGQFSEQSLSEARFLRGGPQPSPEA